MTNDDSAEHGAPDDVRAKFREALERKKSGSGGGGEAHGPTGSKASGATENHKHQRQFRRKSGG
jgi:hypothetical protein